VFQLIFTPEAKADVKNAADYYDSKLHGLGRKFKNELQQKLTSLKQNPLTHSVRYDNVRLAVISRFPYSVHYTIAKKQIMIHA